MYFPVGWPKHLSIGQGRKSCLKRVVSLTCNRYRMLFAVLTEFTVSIWHCRPCVEIVCFRRSDDSIENVGSNDLAEWKQDSSMLAVTTNSGCLLFFHLEQDVKGDKGLTLYNYHQTKTNQGDSSDGIPALRLSLKATINFNSLITSLSCVNEELLVTLHDGRLELLSWDSVNDGSKTVALWDIPFSMDLHVAGHQIKNNICIRHATYSHYLEGFAVVLSDGRAALVAFSPENEAENIPHDTDVVAWNAKGIWAPGLNNATCVAINNKYRLLAFGTEKGDCCVYAIDDVTGGLQLSHTIALSPTHYPNMFKSVGSVLKIDWSPDGCALALSWLQGGISIWSVFGACLMCTLASDRAFGNDGSPNLQGVFKSMCWGVEGYHLWLINENIKSSQPTSKENLNTSQGKDVDNSKQTEQPNQALNKKTNSQNTKKNNKKSARRKLNTDSEQFSGGENVNNSDLLSEPGQLLQLQFVKSSLAINPCMANHCHILIHGEDRMFISCGERPKRISLVSQVKKTRHTNSVSSSHRLNMRLSPMKENHRSPNRRRSTPGSYFSPSGLTQVAPSIPMIEEKPREKEEEEEEKSASAVANKQWTVIQFPLNYLSSNWPIRFTAVDETGCFLAIAGYYGLAHYTVLSRKWKVFGNIMQERDMVVTGGLTWWKEYIVVACYNVSDHQDEIRIYPRITNLDNAFACITQVKSQILLVNIFQDLLIVFTYDCQISIFVISHDNKIKHRPSVQLRSLQEISMARYVPYPALVASVTLTALHMDTTTRRSSSSAASGSFLQRETEVIIVNVAGRLLFLQRAMEDEEEVGVVGKWRAMKFNSPVVLASCVENIWTTPHKNKAKVHLTDALWLGCGGAGIRVWIPLFPPRHSRHQSADGTNRRSFQPQLLTARRITLTFSLDSCYPLAVLFNEAVILGVTCETLQYQNVEMQNNEDKRSSLQFATIERTCEIFLHQILLQLLRRNLGSHALQLAATCRNLTCFPHVLELMLHEVLEEEATASEPIMDPLLPTIVKFLEEFPEYLQTIVHCTRKTEIALWEYLFNSVGSPRELFEECLELGQLETAASYLIILQNLEQLSVARQDATRLFDQALQSQQWELANDIARFLRAIGDGDASATPRHPTLMNANIYPAVAPIHNTSAEQEPFKFSIDERKSLVTRQYSMAPTLEKNKPHKEVPKRATSTRSAPTTPAINLIEFSSKSQSGIPCSPEDGVTTPVAHMNRRLVTRSFTESYFDKIPSPSSTITSPVAQTQVGLHHPYIHRYPEHHHVHRSLQHSASHPLTSSSSRNKRLSGEKELANKEHVASDCAEHYFLDVILARQARKMLSENRIKNLGTFAAYVDFQLVPWLRKERCRAAKIEDAIRSFESLHSDFKWPYPSFAPMRNKSKTNSGGTPKHSQSYTDLGSIQNKGSNNGNNLLMQSQSLYFNQAKRNDKMDLSPKRAYNLQDVGSIGTADEETGSGILTVLSTKDTGSTLTLATLTSEVSESSYAYDDSAFGATSEDLGDNLPPALRDYDQKRGTPRDEMQLQYLLELFLESLCLEWSVLICLMLRVPYHMDRLVKTIHAKENTEFIDTTIPLEVLQRTRDCLEQIEKWSISQCPGYKAVLIQLNTHIQTIYDITNSREVAHAEQQAILANQHKSSNVNLNQSTTTNQLQTPKIDETIAYNFNTQPNSLTKRRQIVPGTAVHYEETTSPSLGKSSKTPPKLDDTPPTSKNERTRRSSEPCENNADCLAANGEPSHSRTPSSPAHLSSPEVSAPPEQKIQPHVEDSQSNSSSEQSGVSNLDDFNDEDIDGSGCAVS